MRDDIKEKGLTAEEMYDCATWRRMSWYIDPIKSGNTMKRKKKLDLLFAASNDDDPSRLPLVFAGSQRRYDTPSHVPESRAVTLTRHETIPTSPTHASDCQLYKQKKCRVDTFLYYYYFFLNLYSAFFRIKAAQKRFT